MVQAVAQLLASAAPVYPVYLGLKLLCGVGMSGATQAGFTLASELTGSTYRTLLTAELWSYMFASMAAFSALGGYVLRNVSWRRAHLAFAFVD